MIDSELDEELELPRGTACALAEDALRPPAWEFETARRLLPRSPDPG